ncbi:MAG: adenine phosphoribosyltransferase [bacterium]
MSDLKSFIREVPDFPQKGISYKDITPLLADPDALKEVTRQLAAPFVGKVDTIVGIESRGFIFGAPVALELGVGFQVVRKPGKLPADTHAITYDLEYGTDTLEIHKDAIPAGSRVLLVDDLLATGGTACATVELLGHLEADIVAAAFVIELTGLPGREALAPVPVHAIMGFGD